MFSLIQVLCFLGRSVNSNKNNSLVQKNSKKHYHLYLTSRESKWLINFKYHKHNKQLKRQAKPSWQYDLVRDMYCFPEENWQVERKHTEFFFFFSSQIFLFAFLLIRRILAGSRSGLRILHAYLGLAEVTALQLLISRPVKRASWKTRIVETNLAPQSRELREIWNVCLSLPPLLTLFFSSGPHL